MFERRKRITMYYIQELICLLGNSNLEKPEVEILNKFTDEKVGFKKASGYDYFNDTCFKRAFQKLKEQGLYIKYKKLVLQHIGDNMDVFSNQMDIEI